MKDNTEKKNDCQSRKWQITINNPDLKGYTHDKIIELVGNFKSLIYMCLSDETGKQGTFHTHIYVHFSSAVRQSSIKKHFEGGHFEVSKGTAQQNRDYVFKEGKWKGTDKEETNHVDSHYEQGELPLERQGHRSDLDDLYDMISSGMTNFDIIKENPSYIMQIDKIDNVRQTLLNEKYRKVFRMVDVTYIYGSTGVGKTRGIAQRHGYENIYIVDDYRNPFDDYEGQDIVVFDEFRSSLPMEKMLRYLDGHPVKLGCRYNNKVACYTTVYIVSNISVQKQYPSVQREEWESYQAFLRRINRVWEYTKDGINERQVKYDEWQPCKTTPFKIAK